MQVNTEKWSSNTCSAASGSEMSSFKVFYKWLQFCHFTVLLYRKVAMKIVHVFI